MKKIVVSAPGKLVLLGEHAVVYHKPSIVTAIDARMKVSIEEREEKKLFLSSPQVGLLSYEKSLSDLGKKEIPQASRFVEIALKNFIETYPLNNGVFIETCSQFSSKLGFGSSSAVTVAVIKALSEVFKKNLSDKEIFNLSYKTILDVQKKGSGIDVAAAVYGKTIYFVTGGDIIENLSVSNFDLVVGYTGEKIDTVAQIEKVKKEAQKNPEKIENIYNQIEAIVLEAKQSLLKNDFKNFGYLMNKNHELLQQLGVSNTKLDAMVLSAIKAGAYGAKLSGGGGDCMIAVCPKEKRSSVEVSIKNVGGEIIYVHPNAQGVKLEK